MAAPACPFATLLAEALVLRWWCSKGLDGGGGGGVDDVLVVR